MRKRKHSRTGFCRICYRAGPGKPLLRNGWCSDCWSEYVNLLCKPKVDGACAKCYSFPCICF